MTLGFLWVLAGACIFRLIEERSKVTTIVGHVDDIFAVGDKERCDQFGRDLNQMVLFQNLGGLRWYSGCSIKGIGRSEVLLFPGRHSPNKWRVNTGQAFARVFRFLLARVRQERSTRGLALSRVGRRTDVATNSDSAKHL